MNKELIEKYLKVVKRSVALSNKYLKYCAKATMLIEQEMSKDDDVEEFDFDSILSQKKKKKKKIKRTIATHTPVAATTPSAVVAAPVAAPIVQTPPVDTREKHIAKLMEIDCWPEAIPSYLVAQPTPDDQINRANAVLDMTLDRNTEGIDFLDFGCGDGWVAKEVSRRGVATSTGFDLLPSEHWKSDGDVTFTNVFKNLKPHGYDIIMLYDVLDHAEDPVGLMKQVRSLIKPEGVVYVRCHPWASKHASHLFKCGLNKSYIHLFLTWEELVVLGYTPLYTRTEKNALEAYKWWVTNSRFKIEQENYIRNPVHEFFLVPAFQELLINEQQLEEERKKGFFQDMEIEFIDLKLSPVT